jgi:hypothetical protein
VCNGVLSSYNLQDRNYQPSTSHSLPGREEPFLPCAFQALPCYTNTVSLCNFGPTSGHCWYLQRPKQTLLYNLLDAIQSSKTQAAVVGISCRLVSCKLCSTAGEQWVINVNRSEPRVCEGGKVKCPLVETLIVARVLVCLCIQMLYLYTETFSLDFQGLALFGEKL